MRAPLLLHTPGEPGGIGHECLLRIAQQASPGCRVALTDAALLQASAQRLGLPITLQPVPATPAATPAGVLYVEDLPTEVPAIPGQCRPEHAAMQLAALRRAVHWLGEAPGALVTGPVQKSALAQAEPGFSGHTEYLAREAGVARVVMLLAAPTLLVVPRVIVPERRGRKVVPPFPVLLLGAVAQVPEVEVVPRDASSFLAARIAFHASPLAPPRWRRGVQGLHERPKEGGRGGRRRGGGGRGRRRR